MPEEKNRVDILLVDDQPAKLLSYESILRELDENLIRANSAAEALAILLKREVGVILTDVCMPDLDGFELVRMLREHPRHEKTAIIFISAIQISDEDRVRGFATGAVDYVAVPVIPEILRAKVKIFVELYRKTRELRALNMDLERRVLERTAALEASAAQLSESEKRLRLASEAAGFGTYDYQTDSIYWSPSLRRIVGFAQEEPLSGERILERVHPSDRDLVLDHMRGRKAGEPTEVEFRIVRPDGEVRWCLARGQRLPNPEGSDDCNRVMGTVIDITERKATEERQRLLMAELDHRVKNVLSNVSAIAHLSSRNAKSVRGFVEDLDGRIQAMSRAHNLLRRSAWRATNVTEIAAEVLAPLRTKGNVEWDTRELWVVPEFVQTLALVLHELATNAAKYGALSVPGGRAAFSWQRVEGRGVQFVWNEAGGPKAGPPEHNGFGLSFLTNVGADLGAKAMLVFTESGLSYRLGGHFETLAPPGGQRPAPASQARNPALAPTSGRRVLVVEDECLVAMQLQQELEEAGHFVVGPARSLEHGLSLAEEEIDAALIDVSLGRVISAPIADRLLARSIPFAFATGYADSAVLPEHLRSMPRLIKPYMGPQVQEMIARLTQPSKSSATLNKEPGEFKDCGV